MAATPYVPAPIDAHPFSIWQNFNGLTVVDLREVSYIQVHYDGGMSQVRFYMKNTMQGPFIGFPNKDAAQTAATGIIEKMIWVSKQQHF